MFGAESEIPYLEYWPTRWHLKFACRNLRQMTIVVHNVAGNIRRLRREEWGEWEMVKLRFRRAILAVLCPVLLSGCASSASSSSREDSPRVVSG